MGESSLTILELHLGDGDIEIGPFELFGAADESSAVVEDESSENAAVDGTDDEAGGCVSAKSVAGLLIALALLVAVAVGVAKLRGGDEEVPPGIAGDN